MHFLQRHAPTHHVESEQWPEFIITEEDLQGEQQEEKEEFYYLMDENEQRNECKIVNEKQFNSNGTNNRNNREPPENTSSDSPAKDQTDKETGDVTCSAQISADQKLSNKPDVNDVNKNYNANQINITNQIATMNMEKLVQYKSPDKSSTNEDSKQENTESVQETLDVSKEIVEQPRNERCEDVIFGELVAAMLKRMDENKKKNIKKEIMNLLLS